MSFYIKQGCIEANGTFLELLNKSDYLKILLSKIAQNNQKNEETDEFVVVKESQSDILFNDATVELPKPIKNDHEETRHTGDLDLNVYKSYFKEAIGIFGTICIIVLFVASQALIITVDYWVSKW